jgi:hypothetical protein
MFLDRLFDVVENLRTENREWNFNTKENVIIHARYMEYIFYVKNCKYGDDANSEEKTKSSEYIVSIDIENVFTE